MGTVVWSLSFGERAPIAIHVLAIFLANYLLEYAHLKRSIRISAPWHLMEHGNVLIAYHRLSQPKT